MGKKNQMGAQPLTIDQPLTIFFNLFKDFCYFLFLLFNLKGRLLLYSGVIIIKI